MRISPIAASELSIKESRYSFFAALFPSLIASASVMYLPFSVLP
jgi:hypothetical protein